MQVLEVARAADAQATMLRRNSNQCARLLLSEAEDRVKILPKEGQGRCRVIWGAGWAKRERDMSVWETRCQVVLLGVYRESRGTGQVGGGHSAVVLLLHYPCTWKQGRVRYRAQEEAAKLWAKEGVQSLGIVRWHVRVLEQAARRNLCTQAQQMWSHMIASEGPARVTRQTTGSLFEAERVGLEGVGGDTREDHFFSTDGGRENSL